MIPKIIHQIWVGPKEPPTIPMDTWKDKHPDFEYIRWNEEEFIKRDMKFECQNRIDEMEQWCGKADIIRLELLYKYGGVFLDADSLCIEPIDDLMDNNFLIYENEKVRKGLIANGIMGFTPKHPFIRKCIDFIINNEVSQAKTDLLPWQVTGPVLITNTYNGGKYDNIKIHPSYYFLPVHNTGLEYQRHGKVYSHQFWGSTNFGNFDKSGVIPGQFYPDDNPVSILCLSYNTKARYIKDCLDSIKNQMGNTSIELVWINDGSDELNTTLLKKLLDDFSNTTRFTKVVYSENDGNKGLGFSLNRGVELCTNEIIMRMDSDDIMVSDRIVKQLEFMNKNPDCVLCGSQINMFKHINNKIVDCGKTNHPHLELDTFMKNTSNHWLMNHPTFCFRKKQILEVGNYNGSIHSMCEDFELILRVLKKYGKIYNMKDVLLYYRLHEDQLTYNGGKEGSRYWTEKRNNLIKKILDINFIYSNDLKHLNYLQIKDYYFIHIPKNAGTSIINQFFKLGNKIGTHYNINYYPINIRKKTFAICRNPYTRLVSCYNYFKMKKSYWHSNDGSTPYGLHELYDYCNKNTFDIFVKDLCIYNKFTNNIHILPQYKWIITPNNEIISKIIKIENINEELSELFNEKIDLIKINKSMSNCDNYYTLESKQLVYEYYKQDFEYFNYDK